MFNTKSYYYPGGQQPTMKYIYMCVCCGVCVCMCMHVYVCEYVMCSNQAHPFLSLSSTFWLIMGKFLAAILKKRRAAAILKKRRAAAARKAANKAYCAYEYRQIQEQRRLKHEAKRAWREAKLAEHQAWLDTPLKPLA